MKDVEKIIWSEKKKDSQTQDMVLEMKNKVFKDGIANTLQKFGIPLRDKTIQVLSTPPKKKHSAEFTEDVLPLSMVTHKTEHHHDPNIDLGGHQPRILVRVLG